MIRRPTELLETWLFSHRRAVLAAFALISVALIGTATQLSVDAGFEKRLPRDHPFMQVFGRYQGEFGGVNRVLVVVKANAGDIYTAPFMKTLKDVTDAVFFLPGVNKASVRSLFTPNTRFIEVIEGGFSGGNVVPAEYQGSDDDLARVRANVLKAGIVGHLVAGDFSAAMVRAELIDADPRTGERLDYVEVAHLLEEQLREPFTNDTTTVHIIGFAKAIGDVADGAIGVLAFFAVALALSWLLVYAFTQSARYTVLLLVCSVLAVGWMLGLLMIVGYGIDPILILVPFLTFAIGVSHGVQVVNAAAAAFCDGAAPEEAARVAFRRILVPGTAALASDGIGFLTILLIDVQVIRELAVTASLGVAAILFTNLLLLPVLISYFPPGRNYQRRVRAAAAAKQPIWRLLARLATWPAAGVVVLVALIIAGVGLSGARGLAVGDLHDGVPELRPDGRYNRDSAIITERFAVGLDVLTVIVETEPDACVDFALLDRVDDFAFRMAQVAGVQSTLSLPQTARRLSAGYNEGHPGWGVLLRTRAALALSVAPVATGTGLLNGDCSVMPVLIFTDNHRAETIDGVVAAVREYAAEHETQALRFRLATGNLGVMGATNDLVRDTRVGMLLWVYGAVIALCLLTFRSLRGTLCVVLPLALVSTLTYALMAQLEIGLKLSTLPIAALGVGIGVDYGIYVFNHMKRALDAGADLPEAYYQAVQVTGNAVLVAALALAVGVSTWIFSDLQFQADMGILLTFMFLTNMAGAVLLLPALARLFFGAGRATRRGRPAATEVVPRTRQTKP